MIYYITRIIILVLIWSGLLLKYKSRFKYILSTSKKRVWALFYFVLISYSVFGMMLYIQVESVFIRFDTPEEAFAYSNVGYKISKIITVEDCAFIVYAQSSKQIVDYINKDDDKWLMVKRTLYRSDKLVEIGKYLVLFVENPSTKQALVLVIRDFPDLSEELDQAVISDNQNGVFDRFQISYEKYDLESFYYYRVVEVSNLDDYEVSIDGLSYRYSK